jgi:hypothetical protein
MPVRPIFPVLFSLFFADAPAFADAPVDLRAAFDAKVGGPNDGVAATCNVVKRDRPPFAFAETGRRSK